MLAENIQRQQQRLLVYSYPKLKASFCRPPRTDKMPGMEAGVTPIRRRCGTRGPRYLSEREGRVTKCVARGALPRLGLPISKFKDGVGEARCFMPYSCQRSCPGTQRVETFQATREYMSPESSLKYVSQQLNFELSVDTCEARPPNLHASTSLQELPPAQESRTLHSARSEEVTRDLPRRR